MPDFGAKRTSFQYPDWQPQYRAALLETDPARLKEKIHDAEVVLVKRSQELTTANDDPERIAIAKAAGALRTLLVTLAPIGHE